MEKDERELYPHHISKNIIIGNISKACSKVLHLLGNQNSNPLSYGNRILVYATLYGQAKKVSDVLKRYNIHLSNPSLDEFTHSATPFIILNNVNRLESYVSASDTVSNFSINSNSGSGGLGGVVPSKTRKTIA